MDVSEVPAASSDSTGSNDANERIPDGKWWAGVLIYAVTNGGFLKLFEICSSITDVSQVLMYMAVYYAAAFALRFILRDVLKLDKKLMPHFFWEPPFYPRRTLAK
jgi:hypothetical protein